MKKYLTPSIEINKFDVEDIITASSDTYASADAIADTTVKAIYTDAVTAGLEAEPTSPATGTFSIVEYQW